MGRGSHPRIAADALAEQDKYLPAPDRALPALLSAAPCKLAGCLPAFAIGKNTTKRFLSKRNFRNRESQSPCKNPFWAGKDRRLTQREAAQPSECRVHPAWCRGLPPCRKPAVRRNPFSGGMGQYTCQIDDAGTLVDRGGDLSAWPRVLAYDVDAAHWRLGWDRRQKPDVIRTGQERGLALQG